MTYIDKIKEKINNVYPILPINGFLMVEEKREKENKVKVLMLNYAWKSQNSNYCGRIGNGEHQELMTYTSFFPALPAAPSKTHTCTSDSFILER